MQIRFLLYDNEIYDIIHNTYNHNTSSDKTNSNSKYLWKIKIFRKTSKKVLKKSPKNQPLKTPNEPEMAG